MVRYVPSIPAFWRVFNSKVFKYKTPAFLLLGFPCGSAGKESACNAGDLGSIPGLGRSPRGGEGYPFQYSGLEDSMDCIVHVTANGQRQLSDFHFHFPFVSICKMFSFSFI